MSILRFLYQTLCAFLHIKDRKHIEQNFHSVAGVVPQGWDLGVLGGSKTLAWGFAMAPHQLRILFCFCFFHFEMQIIVVHMVLTKNILIRGF